MVTRVDEELIDGGYIEKEPFIVPPEQENLFFSKKPDGTIQWLIVPTKTSLMLSAVNNTPDNEKEVSEPQQAALDMKADLDENGKILKEQIPSYIDEYEKSENFFRFDTYDDLPLEGSDWVIYYTEDNHRLFVWDHDKYQSIGDSIGELGPGEDMPPDNWGLLVYRHILITAGNPHGLTKDMIDLGNVPNAISDSISLDNSNSIASSKAVLSLKTFIEQEVAKLELEDASIRSYAESINTALGTTNTNVQDLSARVDAIEGSGPTLGTAASKDSSSAIDSDTTATVADSKAVKLAYDKAVAAETLATSAETLASNAAPSSHTHTPAQVGLGNIPNAISDSTTLDSSATVASSKAVKAVKDALASITVQDASETVKGIAERATNAEALAGTDAERFMTPAITKNLIESIACTGCGATCSTTCTGTCSGTCTGGCSATCASTCSAGCTGTCGNCTNN